MTRFSSAALAFLFLASTTSAAKENSPSATNAQHVRRGGSNTKKSDSTGVVHECDMTVSIPFHAPKTIKVKPTDKVKEVNQSIAKAYGVDGVPAMQHFVVGIRECQANTKLSDCGICSREQGEPIQVKVEFAKNSMIDYVLRVTNQVAGGKSANRNLEAFPVFEEPAPEPAPVFGEPAPEFASEEDPFVIEGEEEAPPVFDSEEEPPAFFEEPVIEQGEHVPCELPPGVEFGKYNGNNRRCVSDFGFEYGWTLGGCVDGIYTLDRTLTAEGVALPVTIDGTCPESAYVEVVVTCNPVDNSVTLSWNAHDEAKVAVRVKGQAGGVLYDTTAPGIDSGTFYAPLHKTIDEIEFCLQCDGCGDDNPDDQLEGPPPLAPGFCYRDMNSDDPYQDHLTYIRRPPYEKADGSDYRGKVDETAEAIPCQPWSSQTPHPHPMDPIQHPEFGLESNYCRNPGGFNPEGVATKPWCFTSDPDIEWRNCEVGIRPVEKLAHGSPVVVDGVRGTLDKDCNFVPQAQPFCSDDWERPLQGLLGDRSHGTGDLFPGDVFGLAEEPVVEEPDPFGGEERRRKLAAAGSNNKKKKSQRSLEEFPVFQEPAPEPAPVFGEPEPEFASEEDPFVIEGEEEAPPVFTSEEEPPAFFEEPIIEQGEHVPCELPPAIEFVEYPGMLSCVSDFGFEYGWKMDGCVDGIYTLDRTLTAEGVALPVEITGTCPESAYVEVVVTCKEDGSVDLSWNAHDEAKVVIRMQSLAYGELHDTTGVKSTTLSAPRGADIAQIEFCLQCDGCGDDNPDDEFEGAPPLEPGFCYRDMNSDDQYEDHETYQRKPPYDKPDASDYRGTVHETAEGIPCQPWASQTPHPHPVTEMFGPEDGIESNYCRNPGGLNPEGEATKPWCFTSDPDIEWRNCEVGIRPVEKLAHGSPVVVKGVKGRLDTNCEFVPGGKCTSGKIKVKYGKLMRVFTCIEATTTIEEIKVVFGEFFGLHRRAMRLSYRGTVLTKPFLTLIDYGYDMCDINPKILVLEDMPTICEAYFER